MKKLMKKAVIIMCLCTITAAACACSSDNLEIKLDAAQNVDAINLALAEKNDPNVTVAETTINKEENQFTVEYESSNIDDSDDIKTAREFFIAYVGSIYRCENNADFDRFISDKNLKAYLENDVKAHYIESTRDALSHNVTLRLSTSSITEANGINYITFRTNYLIGDGSIAARCQVGVRDGNVVNFDDVYHISNYGYLWNSDITEPMSTNGYDVSQFPNPWDDEKTAERLVKAQELFHNGEYELFSDAWNSLGE